MRMSRRPLASVTFSAASAVLTLILITSSAASAQIGKKTPLKGKNAFSLERFEESLFDERAKAIQAKMSKIRKKKIKTLESIVKSNRPYQNKADVLNELEVVGERVPGPESLRVTFCVDINTNNRLLAKELGRSP